MNQQVTVSNTSSTLLALATSLIFVSIVFVALLAKKFYYYFYKRKRFFIFPRYDVKGITNVSMVIAIAVAVILLLIFITGGVAGFLFRAYPGTRVTFELILVKVSGILFGPVVGFISGALIDLLTFSLSAGVFHYGYFISVALAGLLSGTLRSVITMSNNKVWRIALFSSIYLLGTTAIVILMFDFFSGITQSGLNVNLAGIIDLHLSFTVFLLLIIGFIAFSILIIWILVWISSLIAKRKRLKARLNTYQQSFDQLNREQRRSSDRNQWISWLIISIVVSVSCTLVIYITLLPVFDSMLDKQPYQWWLGLRLISTLPLTLLDIAVIFPILLLVVSLMKYDDKESVFAELHEPLFYQQYNLDMDSIKRNKKSIEQIAKYGQTMKFDIGTKQIRILENEFMTILDDFQLVLNINTENVEPMNYPRQGKFDETRLREDFITPQSFVYRDMIMQSIKNKTIYDNSEFVVLKLEPNKQDNKNLSGELNVAEKKPNAYFDVSVDDDY